jgi:hypothetical protein
LRRHQHRQLDHQPDRKIAITHLRVTVHTDDTNTFPQPYGTQTSVIDWETLWANVAMSVERCRGDLKILMPAGVFVPESARAMAESDINESICREEGPSNG